MGPERVGIVRVGSGLHERAEGRMTLILFLVQREHLAQPAPMPSFLNFLTARLRVALQGMRPLAEAPGLARRKPSRSTHCLKVLG